MLTRTNDGCVPQILYEKRNQIIKETGVDVAADDDRASMPAPQRPRIYYFLSVFLVSENGRFEDAKRDPGMGEQ